MRSRLSFFNNHIFSIKGTAVSDEKSAVSFYSTKSDLLRHKRTELMVYSKVSNTWMLSNRSNVCQTFGRSPPITVILKRETGLPD